MNDPRCKSHDLLDGPGRAPARKLLGEIAAAAGLEAEEVQIGRAHV